MQFYSLHCFDQVFRNAHHNGCIVGTCNRQLGFLGNFLLTAYLGSAGETEFCLDIAKNTILKKESL